MCPYVKVIGYHEMPICEKTNNICPMMRRCTTHTTWLPLNGMYGCKLRNEIELPKGAYAVRFKKHNKLYVSVNGQIKMIPYDGDDTPQYVFLTKRNGEYKLKKGDNAN